MEIEEARLVVNENGRVVIPAQFRKALGINAGDEIVLRLQENELKITTQKTGWSGLADWCEST